MQQQTIQQEPPVNTQAVAPAPVQEAVAKSELKTDQINDIKTIYNVSSFEIFWRNFLAGLARAFGGIFVYLFFLGIVGFIAAQVVWPRVQPLVLEYQKALTTINKLNTLNNQAGSPSQIDLQELIDQNLQDLLKDPTTRQPGEAPSGFQPGR